MGRDLLQGTPEPARRVVTLGRVAVEEVAAAGDGADERGPAGIRLQLPTEPRNVRITGRSKPR
jgi:hypothetical protein